MRKLSNLFSLFALVTGCAAAQVTRVEVTPRLDPAHDSKPNSDSVPDAYAIETQFDRVVIFRLKYQTDLLAGIEKLVKTQNIRNAVILAAAGSVCNYRLHDTSSRSFPSRETVVEDATGPADILSLNGYVIDGRVHAHVTMANPHGAFGGHLERGTSVFTSAAITIGVFRSGIDLSKIDDKTYR
jgi:uncharacterized protein